MDLLKQLNLENLAALRDLELGYPVHEAMRDRLLWGDVDVPSSPSLQQLVGQPCALSQNAFSAFIIRQGGVRNASEALPRHTLKIGEGGRVDHEHRVD